MKIQLNLLAIFFLLIFLTLSCNTERETENTEGQQLLSDPGVVSFTFRHEFEEDFTGTLDFIKEMGVTNIEFSNLFGKTAQEIRDLLDERGMRCTSYGVGYDDLLEDIDRVAEEAHILGARHVRVATIPHDSPFDIEDARSAVNDFNQFGRQLKERDLLFSYHNHGYEFREYEDGTLFDYIVQNTNPEYVNFQLDVFWVVWPGHDPVELVERYPDRFKTVHLKDLAEGVEGDLSGRAPSEHMVVLGEGQVDFKSLLVAAQDSNIEYFYLEDEVEDVKTSVPKSYEYITSLTY
ncbi:sugar phosphate isomerase/epimerase family protein [Natronogracilivirga saccharolytica]|uniref:Sugar phosphate isomerase/epimerase n=1 Tax=Natronogracilivirga saccharolytica TaxID=2812953 RepID=A0A8J7S8D8_9BACT|nr:sugar phosphate isomerase/epimerase [Natronogracilivirga saccharolytica]MBP3193858.1 sugar phosphate isomerase/epimerase [Natronogracilivirga saccharolytica]